MKQYTAQKQINKQQFNKTLVEELSSVPDHRSDQGKRHLLAVIPSIVLPGLLKGKTSIEAKNKKLVKKAYQKSVYSYNPSFTTRFIMN